MKKKSNKIKSAIKKITVKATADRLDVFLTNLLEISRSQVQKLMSNNLISLNGQRPKKSGSKIKKGDKITVNQLADLSTFKSLSPFSHRSGNIPGSYQKKVGNIPGSYKKKVGKELKNLKLGLHSALAIKNFKIKVITETPDYVVIDKPTGVLSHPTMAGESNAVTAWLVQHYPETKKVGDNPELRPGIVHRLDKEASGLMVIARTSAMFDCLKKQFKERTNNKEYLALAHGRVVKDWDEITFPLARSRTNDRMAARPLPPSLEKRKQALVDVERENQIKNNILTDTVDPEELLARLDEKEARTEFVVEKRFVNFTLLRVTIHTGRMHQIRAHLLAYNQPLVGDPLYFQKKRLSKWDNKLGRLFLHATTLSFTDLNGLRQTFTSALPKKLSNFLSELA